MPRTRYPRAMEALPVKTWRHARRTNKRNRAPAMHNRAGIAWATGRSPVVRPARIEAHSAEFARAQRRGRTATMDSPAWELLEVVAAGSMVAAAGSMVVAVVDEAAVVVAGRGERKS